MIDENKLKEFYKGKKVLITGHTGFKGSWMCRVLKVLGADVYGYALKPPTNPSLFETLCIADDIHNYEGDVRDLPGLLHVFSTVKPEIVIHMAAQPLVRESYKDPVGTYSSNVMGTVNVLECCRICDSVISAVNVTTDKVYRNNEQDEGYIETDYLDGYDPYSNSKSCSELVTHSYVQSFFSNENMNPDGVHNRILPVSTCRAGNVIGGGDFALDRIIPDCFRAAQKHEDIIVRNPYSTRPYEHVLEPVFTYLMVAMEQSFDKKLASNYNVGPDDESCVTTGQLVNKFCDAWNATQVSYGLSNDDDIKWINKHDGGPHEAGFLKLNCNKLKSTFDWKPTWNIDDTITKTVEWYSEYMHDGNIMDVTDKQIKEFMEGNN